MIRTNYNRKRMEGLTEKINLIREFALKDLKIRYSRPVLGFLWTFLSPILTVMIFYLIFGLVLKVKTEEAPFVLYLMSGVFPWMFFQDSILKSVTSLVDNKNLIREASFPHYLIPVSIVTANAVIFLPSLFIVLFSSLFILKGLPVFILLLPMLLIIHLIVTLLLSVIFSVLYVKWRDLKYALEAVFLLLFYLTPVFYSVSLIKESFSNALYKVYICNPFVGILSLYRIVFLKGFFAVIKDNMGFLPIIAEIAVFIILVSIFAVYLYKKNKGIINDYLAY
jgi:lipopolysaccharide transport system permease protein